MKCTLCKHGETITGYVTITLERGQTIIIIKEVPASICNNCGEYYLTEDVTGNILSMAEKAVMNHAEIEILRYVA